MSVEVHWLGSPLVREVVVGCFARSRNHCETARLVFKDRMPAALHRESEIARARFLAQEPPCEA